jgi:periplasmic divalent cation tolerance protein
MRIVIATAPVPIAAKLAKTLVEEHLVACVNIVPLIRSIYLWNDKIEDEEEALLLIKTSAAAIEQLTTRLKELHPYDVPEIISVTPNSDEGNGDYLEWVQRVVGDPKKNISQS